MSGKTFIEHFSALDDPRQAWKVVYPLPEILLLVLCGTLAGAEDFVEIARWGRRKLAFLRRLLPFARGVPSHDTLNDVMNALPAGLFAETFTAWVAGLRESEPDIVAIDGKTSRRARARGRHPLHLVSAWASRQRLVLGQEAVEEKSNEINAIPLLLERLDAAVQAAHHSPHSSRASTIAQQRRPRSSTNAAPGLPAAPCRTSCIISVVMNVPFDQWNQNRWPAKSGSSLAGTSLSSP